MTDHKMTRHEMKQNDLVTAFERTRDYARKNPTSLRNVGLGAVVVMLVLAGAFWTWSNRRAEAASLLQAAQQTFAAPVLEPGAAPPAAGPSFTSEADRDRAALEAFQKVVDAYGARREGRLARYYSGVLLARLGRDAESESAITAFLESPPTLELAALARAQLGQLRVRAGRLDDAVKIYQELADDVAASYPKDWALFYLAGALSKQGKADEANRTYRRIVSEFPASYLAGEAKRLSGGA